MERFAQHLESRQHVVDKSCMICPAKLSTNHAQPASRFGHTLV